MYSPRQKAVAVALLIAGAIAFCTAPTSAQDQFPRPEDLLRWFPLGDYDLIVHKDYQTLQEAPTWDIYSRLFDPHNSWIKIDFQLPRPFQQDILSATMAQALSIRTAVFRDPEKAKNYKEVYGDMLTTEVINDRIFKFESVGSRYFVFRYLYAEDKLSRCLSTGQMEKIKLRLYDRPVYTFHQVILGKSVDFFAYLSEDQEFLIAPSLSELARMVHTGRGYFLALIDGRDYQDLPYLSEELGNSWQFTSYSAHHRALLHRMRVNNVSFAKQAVVRDKLLENSSYKIKSLTLDNSLTFRALNAFGTLSRASEWHQKNQYGTNIDFLNSSFFNRNYLLFFQPAYHALQGTTVISQVSYQDNDVIKLKDYLSTLPEMKKRQQQLIDSFKDKKEAQSTPD